MINRVGVARYFDSLTLEEQLVILECALAGLRDELSDGFLRRHRLLDLDLTNAALKPVYDELAKFMEEAE